MSTQNIQNYIPLQPVQNNIPVPQVSEFIPSQYIQGQTPAYQPIQNNNYIPTRYSSLIQDGVVYAAPVPSQVQPVQQNLNNGGTPAVNITINGVNSPSVPQNIPPLVQYYLPVNNKPVAESTEPKKEPLTTAALEKKPEETTKNKPAVESAEPKKEPLPAATTEKKPVVELTDDYVQQLEKNLNDSNKSVRLHAVAELITKFKEDQSRKDDIRLTNLLNVALQDDSKPVVFAAMQALENGYAVGNPVTVERLQAIKDKKDTFGNSETAEVLLTKIAGIQPDNKHPDSVSDPKLNLVSR